MIHIVPATQIKNKFGEILRRVYAHQDHIVVEKSGIQVAAIIPIADYKNNFAGEPKVDNVKTTDSAEIGGDTNE